MKRIIILLAIMACFFGVHAGTITIQNNSPYKFNGSGFSVVIFTTGTGYSYSASGFQILTGLSTLNYTGPENFKVAATGTGSGIPFVANSSYLFELGMSSSDAPCGTGFLVRANQTVYNGCHYRVTYSVSGINKDVLITIDPT